MIKIRFTNRFLPTWYKSKTCSEIVIQILFVCIMFCWARDKYGDRYWLDDSDY